MPSEEQAQPVMNEKLIDSIKKFVTSYNVLSPAGKTAFASQLKAQMKRMDKRTRLLYEALLEATKNELGIEKTIKEMEKADRQAKDGI